MKKSKISILGCGWLGLPLAKKLINLGYKVKGSTTSASKLVELKAAGIQPFLIQIKENNVEGAISECLEGSDTIIINIPPGLRKNPDKNHVLEIEQLITFVEKSTIENVLFISSTSVFEDDVSMPTITKDTKPSGTSNSVQQLIEIEGLLRRNFKFNSTVLRFSGLFDEERHPGKYLSGRENISNPEAPVNLIHKEDCIELISKILDQNLWNISVNASFPHHPTKEKYYSTYCKTHQLPLPQFDKINPSKGKIIDGSNLAQLLKYKYELSL